MESVENEKFCWRKWACLRLLWLWYQLCYNRTWFLFRTWRRDASWTCCQCHLASTIKHGGFKGHLVQRLHFHFSSQQNPGHSHHRFDAVICRNSRHRHFQKVFSVYFNIRGLTAKVFDVLHTVALTMSLWACNAVGRISLSCSRPVWKTLLCVTCDSMGGSPIQNAPDVVVQSLQIF